jgi:hypothetical protein
MPELTVLTSQTPSTPDAVDGEARRVLATIEQSTVDTNIVGIRWFAPQTLTGITAVLLSVWSLTGNNPASGTGSRLVQLTLGSITAGVWNRVNLGAPLAWPQNTPRAAQVAIEGSRYTYTPPDVWPITNGTLSALDEATSGNGRWTNGGSAGTFMDSLAANNFPGGDGYNFFVELVTDVSPASGHAKGAEFLPFF